MQQDERTHQLILEMHSTMRVLDERSRNILTQAEKTNGRVNKLEERVDQIDNKQAGLLVKMSLIVSGIGAFSAAVVSKILT